MNISLFTAILSIAAVGLLGHAVFAQTTEPQTTGEVYMALALSIINIAGNVFNAYLAQKAKLTGKAPNETDVAIAQALADLQQRFANSEKKGAQLIDFLFNNAVPEQARNIVEGSLPLIKVKAVTNDVKEANSKFLQAVDLLNAVQIGAAETKPIDKVAEDKDAV